MAPFAYAGGRDTCIGCADIIRTGDMVAPIAEDRPDRLVCIACSWLTACDLAWPRWARSVPQRTNLAGVFARRTLTAP